MLQFNRAPDGTDYAVGRAGQLIGRPAAGLRASAQKWRKEFLRRFVVQTSKSVIICAANATAFFHFHIRLKDFATQADDCCFLHATTK